MPHECAVSTELIICKTVAMRRHETSRNAHPIRVPSRGNVVGRELGIRPRTAVTHDRIDIVCAKEIWILVGVGLLITLSLLVIPNAVAIAINRVHSAPRMVLRTLLFVIEAERVSKLVDERAGVVIHVELDAVVDAVELAAMRRGRFSAGRELDVQPGLAGHAGIPLRE